MKNVSKSNVKAAPFIFTLFIFLFASCADEFGSSYIPDDGRNLNGPSIEVGEASRTYPNVDESFWVFFERFENEGNKRGWDIDLKEEGFTGEIGHLPSVGSCTYDLNHTMHHITMDKSFWESASDGKKELIMFHELGHCFLRRDHNNDRDEHGICKSVMRAGLGECIDDYHGGSRDDYLEELFAQ